MYEHDLISASQEINEFGIIILIFIDKEAKP